MKNFRGEGEAVDMVVTFNCVGGNVYIVNDIVAIASRSSLANQKATFKIYGVFEVPKNPSEAMLPGQAVYWDAVNNRLTKTVGSNKKFGFTVESAQIGDPNVIAYLYALS